jgi:hypothetical protein
MKKGWTLIGATGRWVTTWQRKDGFISLNAFPSGNWSITCKDEATQADPHGIITGSFIVDRIERDLVSAMDAAERAAKQLDAVPMNKQP